MPRLAMEVPQNSLATTGPVGSGPTVMSLTIAACTSPPSEGTVTVRVPFVNATVHARCTGAPTARRQEKSAMTPGSFIIKPTTVVVKLAAPIPTAGLGMESRDSLIAEMLALR